MKTKSYSLRLTALAFSVLFLAACGPTAAESPDVVLQKFQTNLANVNSADTSFTMVMQGSDADEAVNLNFDMDLAFDRTDKESPKGSAVFAVNGNLKSPEKDLSGTLNFEVIALNEETYVKLNTLDANDPSVQFIKPLLSANFGKWFHISKDFLPENVRDLSEANKLIPQQEAQLKELFASADIFTLVEDKGVEKVEGGKAYHYAVRLNPEGVKAYLEQMTDIVEPELTAAQKQVRTQDLEASLQTLQSLSAVDLWIGVSDYYPYNAEFKLSGKDIAGTELPTDAAVDMTLTVTGKDFNKSQSISAPKDAEEFNPLALLGGGAGISPSSAMPALDAVDTPEMEVIETE